ncbi:hypothetical protein MLD38_006829 [Melastoma candidum]|uniref:Uncharacterized protein n=1 Tax=Melastoma candidum TaxID=119954 RepID=A0ACB9RXL3_9MYRT|nr:hypothetical protein MLD38_006829 [Melastoma candidum]
MLLSRGFRSCMLDKIDSELLNHSMGGFATGGWFYADKNAGGFAGNVSPNVTVFRPDKGMERLRKLISGLLSTRKLSVLKDHC